MKTKSMLLLCGGLLAMLALLVIFINGNDRAGTLAGAASATAPAGHAAPPPRELPGGNPSENSATRDGAGPGPATGRPAARDAAALLAAALRESDPARRQALLRQWANAVDLSAMEKTVASLSALGDSDRQAEACQALLASWAERDVPSLAEWFGKQKVADELHQQARDILVRQLGQRDPHEAFGWMEKSLGEAVRKELYAPFFRQWAGSDPASAGAKLRQLLDGAEGRSAMWDNLVGPVASAWQDSDMTGAVDWIQSLPNGPIKAQALLQASFRWTDSDPLAAASYATQQHDPILIKAVAAQWAESDPINAASWAAGLPADGGRDDAIGNVTARWASTDAASTARWAAQFPEGSSREQVFGQLFTVWAGTNPTEAGRFLQTLPPARSRDFAVSAFCNVTEATAPNLSFDWAGTIADPTLRSQRQERAAVAWLEKNPDVARPTIAQSNLPDNIKTQLLASEPARK